MKNNIQIRKAKTKDIRAITKLHKKIVSEVNSAFYSPEVIKEWLNKISEGNVNHQFQNSVWIVAEIDSKIIGFGQYSVKDRQIYQINVDPKYLNQNIGKRLYEYIENGFKNNEIGKINLNSTLNAVGFYQKLGFEIVQEINFKLSRQSLKMVKMEKSLRKDCQVVLGRDIRKSLS